MERQDYSSEEQTGSTPSADSEDEEDHGDFLHQVGDIKIYGIGTGYHDNLDQVIRAIKFFPQKLEDAKVGKSVIAGKIHNKPGNDSDARDRSEERRVGKEVSRLV